MVLKVINQIDDGTHKASLMQDTDVKDCQFIHINNYLTDKNSVLVRIDTVKPLLQPTHKG